jgi:hypothetical protein
MNHLKFSSSSILLLSLFTAPAAFAGMENSPPDNRIEQVQQRSQNQTESVDRMDKKELNSENDPENADTRTEETQEKYRSQEINSDETNNYNVRRTEAFNLVSSAYRGKFEEQGISGYGVLITNYQDGKLTAEDLIEAAIKAGELSPQALEDEDYINAVELQLDNLSKVS